MSSPILNFGKHKGEKLSKVPLKYLAWLLIKYEGKSLSREEIEKEAISRGCEKRNGRWGIRRPSSAAIGMIVNDMFPSYVSYDENFDHDNADIEDDPWVNHCMPNMDY